MAMTCIQPQLSCDDRPTRKFIDQIGFKGVAVKLRQHGQWELGRAIWVSLPDVKRRSR